MENPVVMEADSQAESNEANLEKLNLAEIRQKTAHILSTLIETGECDIDALLSMMKMLSVDTSRLMQIKEKYEGRVTEAEKKLLEKTENLNLVSKLFNSVKQPKVWENFSVAQRNTIDSWIQEFEASNSNYTETSDDNNANCDMDDASASNRVRLQELIEERKMLLERFKEANEKKKEWERKLQMQKSRLQELQQGSEEPSSSSSDNASTKTITPKEIHLISLISVFLSAYQFGANIHRICFYLNQFDNTIEAGDVESLMKKFPLVFREECTGIGTMLEKKWYFRKFQSS